MMPKVSILIPCYNAERWIAEAIQSALDQTWINKEVIVVDDGSTDGSLDVIKSFDGKIQWETGPNRGGNVARNRLLKLSSGEWLQYLDADDYLENTKVERQIDEADDLELADLLWSPSVYEYVEKDIVSREVQQLQDEDPWIALIRWRLPQTGASLWRRKSLIAVGGWKPDQPCCQEHELYLRLLISHARFHFCPSALSIYRQWSIQTLCRKDPIFTTQRRMEIVNQVERHLSSISKLTPSIQEQLFATRVQCARSVYSTDFAVSREIITNALKASGSRSLPEEAWFPRMYRILFRYTGFRIAENVAALRRQLAQLILPPSN